MDHYTAVDLLRAARPTWGQLRDHLLDCLFDHERLPDTSSINPAVPLMKAWDIYDKALAVYDVDAKPDFDNARDVLLAANVVRDFGLPEALICNTADDVLQEVQQGLDKLEP